MSSDIKVRSEKEPDMKTKTLVLAAVLLTCSAAAQAAPVRWDVDIQLASGGAVTGSYVFDADTGVFSDIMVSATGSPFPPASASLTSYLPTFSSSSQIDFVPAVPDLTGYEDVFVVLSSPMTNAGGVIAVWFVSTTLCLSADCLAFDFLTITLGDGFVGSPTVSAAVPEPTGMALVALGMMGLAVTRRRKRA